MAPKTTPFQEKHALEFGLELIKMGKGGVQTVRCLFCIYNRRDKVEHGKTNAEYSELCNAEKREYITGKTKIVNTLHHYLDVEDDTMEFNVSPPIVDTIIGNMFLRNDGMLDNAEDDDKDDLVASDAAKAVAKKIAKKSSEKAHAMKL
ncbi:unnamed protein product [Hyaloperonospora brassicae]|uniref:Uncharacterized protein n=1 Tax=Hyaloperonospora brassicae TaxID=162125 RepID=A0AAV0TQW6_HYABA|nr:unnamed protein product [Hyaloperonospora brassicae]